MSGAVIAAIVRLAGLAGVKLSPFWASAALAGLLALIIGGGASRTSSGQRSALRVTLWLQP
ncbi:hypothetical protein [Bradyrhizobium liaoningense]|uniref:hypothetical protein n=1 Tax=Bradyrhizobium liaoningense TaxID=43992 RepID=UPI001BA7DEA8|nr:hypothetical protein [Bradyrhizobium liaoningense]MBR0823495.1 hypothetical protein [Bradyrhizobium liaoningense]